MDSTLLQQLAAGNSWCAIAPEVGLVALALLLLLIEVAFPSRAQEVVPKVGLAGQLAVLALVIFRAPPGTSDAFDGLLKLTASGRAMEAYFLVSSILVCGLAQTSLAGRAVPRVEFHHTVIVVAAALMLLAQSNHFVLLFIALETVTV